MCRASSPGHAWGTVGVLGAHLPLPALLQEEACASAPGSPPARRGMEPGRSVPVEQKLRKPSQRARIPAPFFTHLVGRWLGPRPPARPLGCRPPSEPPAVTLPVQDGAAEPADPPGQDPAEADAESLVPTHDERGRPIPEWKRQVMVRRLRARLADEEAAGGQVRTGRPGAGAGARCRPGGRGGGTLTAPLRRTRAPGASRPPARPCWAPSGSC